MAPKLTPKHKTMAYILWYEFGYSMADIGNLMRVSQSTISNAIKQVEYERRLHNLENELNSAKEELKSLGYTNKRNDFPAVIEEAEKV
jgi:hypothetical protein